VDEVARDRNLSVERSLLGSLLLFPEALERVPHLQPRHFWSSSHRQVYRAILDLREAGTLTSDGAHTLAIGALAERLNGSLEQIGGLDALASYCEGAIPGNVESDADVLISKWKRRAAALIARKLEEAADSDEFESLLEKAHEDIAQLLEDEHVPVGVFDPATHSDYVLEHLWEPYLPRNKPILLTADSGTGKSFFVINLCAMLSNGRRPMDDQQYPPVASGYFHVLEDEPEEIVTVYHKAGGAPGFVVTGPQSGRFDLTTMRGRARIKAVVREHHLEHLVLDPVSAFVGRDLDKNTEDVAEAVRPIRELCRDLGITITAVRHIRKAGPEYKGDAAELVLGSVMWKAGFRGLLMLRPHPLWAKERERHFKGIVVLSDLKGSLMNRRGDGFCFKRVGDELQFLPDEPDPFEKGSEAPRAKLQSCQDWLKALLTGQQASLQYVIEQADNKGYSGATLKRARQLLNVQSHGDRRSGALWLTIPVHAGLDYNPYEDE